MLKTVFKFGALGGVAVCLYVFVLTKSGAVFSDGPARYLGFLAIVIMPVCTFLALKELRDKSENFELTFSKAMIAGLLLSLVAAGVYSGVTWVEHEVLGNAYREKLIEVTQREMLAEGKSTLDVQKQIDKLNAHYNSYKPCLNTFVWYAGLGVLYSAASFLLLKHFIKSKPVTHVPPSTNPIENNF